MKISFKAKDVAIITRRLLFNIKFYKRLSSFAVCRLSFHHKVLPG